MNRNQIQNFILNNWRWQKYPYGYAAGIIMILMSLNY